MASWKSPALYLLLIFSLVAVLISITTTVSPSLPSSKIPAKFTHEIPTADVLRRDRARIRARIENFKRLDAKAAQRLSTYLPIDHQNHGQYFIRYKIGTPSVDTFGIFDTASSLIWLQCEPCSRCYNQSIPIYDPKNSSSYAGCPDPNGECRYKIQHQGTSSSSEGEIATESITIGDTNSLLTNVTFGCGHDNNAATAGPGVVGFSRESSSLVGQALIKYFAYCISSDPTHSRLTIGYPRRIHENTTPLLSGKHGLYYLSLEGIGVGGTKLNIPTRVFNMTQDGEQGGIFMDSATMYTMLASEAFGELKTAVTNALSGFHSVADSDGLFHVCYNDRGFRLDQTPKVVFHFSGLDFQLTANNTWVMNSQGHYCLAMLPKFEGGPSIFGLYQHRDVNVRYDLFDNFVYLKHTTFCEL